MCIRDSSYGVNILLNYGFIFGKFGLPEMGITGVAIGTLLARGIEFVCVLVHMLCLNKKVRMKLSDFVKRDKLLFKDFMTYAAPSLLKMCIRDRDIGEKATHVDADLLQKGGVGE